MNKYRYLVLALFIALAPQSQALAKYSLGHVAAEVFDALSDEQISKAQHSTKAEFIAVADQAVSDLKSLLEDGAYGDRSDLSYHDAPWIRRSTRNDHNAPMILAYRMARRKLYSSAKETFYRGEAIKAVLRDWDGYSDRDLLDIDEGQRYADRDERAFIEKAAKMNIFNYCGLLLGAPEGWTLTRESQNEIEIHSPTNGAEDQSAAAGPKQKATLAKRSIDTYLNFDEFTTRSREQLDPIIERVRREGGIAEDPVLKRWIGRSSDDFPSFLTFVNFHDMKSRRITTISIYHREKTIATLTVYSDFPETLTNNSMQVHLVTVNALNDLVVTRFIQGFGYGTNPVRPEEISTTQQSLQDFLNRHRVALDNYELSAMVTDIASRFDTISDSLSYNSCVQYFKHLVRETNQKDTPQMRRIAEELGEWGEANFAAKRTMLQRQENGERAQRPKKEKFDRNSLSTIFKRYRGKLDQYKELGTRANRVSITMYHMNGNQFFMDQRIGEIQSLIKDCRALDDPYLRKLADELATYVVEFNADREQK